MARLIWPTFGRSEISQQWIPDPLGDVVVVQRVAVAVAEYVPLLAGGSLLLLQCVVDYLGHLNDPV